MRFITFGSLYFSVGVAVTGAEVDSGSTDVQLTCTISGVVNPPTISWNDGSNNIASDADFDVGTVSLNGNTAVSILTVKKASTATATYTCLVTSTEWAKTDEPHSAELKIFSKLQIIK